MKINEIITEQTLDEGFWDSAKKIAGGIKGAVSGVRDARNIRQGQQQVQNIAKTFIDKWNQSVGANPAIAQDANRLLAFMKKSCPNIARTLTVVPTDMSPQGIGKYISDCVGKEMSSLQVGNVEEPAAEPKNTATTAPKLAKGVILINQEPIIFKYGKGVFHLNDTGVWVSQNEKPANGTLQAFLNQQHNAVLGITK